MKIKVSAMASALVASAVLFVGCKSTTPPTAFEQVLFATKTNVVEQVVEVPTEVFVTNIVNQVKEIKKDVWVTNVVQEVKVVPNLVTETNLVEVYSHEVSSDAKGDIETIGGVVNTFAPGIGSIFSGILLGAAGAWAKMRSYKKSGTVLAQNIEAIREFIKTSVPNGAQYDQALVKYLSENQQELGAANSVVALLNKYVSNKDARIAATEIKGLLDSLKPKA